MLTEEILAVILELDDRTICSPLVKPPFVVVTTTDVAVGIDVIKPTLMSALLVIGEPTEKPLVVLTVKLRLPFVSLPLKFS